MRLIGFILLFVLCLKAEEVHQTTASVSLLADTTLSKREMLWERFQKKRPRKRKGYPKIRIYGENEDLSAICYISEEQLYLFRFDEKINRGQIHAIPVLKSVNLSGVNAISFGQENGRDYKAFLLWNNGVRVLSVGAYSSSDKRL